MGREERRVSHLAVSKKAKEALVARYTFFFSDGVIWDHYLWAKLCSTFMNEEGLIRGASFACMQIDSTDACGILNPDS